MSEFNKLVPSDYAQKYKITGASGEFTVVAQYDLEQFIQLVAASQFIMSDETTCHLPPFWKVEKVKYDLKSVTDE